MATQIKVANEAKQDITISKADQILGRLADQTITKTIKSIQTGVFQSGDYPCSSGIDYLLTSDGRMKLASISPVDINKCVCDVLDSSDGYQSSLYTAASFSPSVGGKSRYSLEFKSDGVYTEIIRGTSGYHTANNNSNYFLKVRSIRWRIIEFY